MWVGVHPLSCVCSGKEQELLELLRLVGDKEIRKVCFFSPSPPLPTGRKQGRKQGSEADIMCTFTCLGTL